LFFLGRYEEALFEYDQGNTDSPLMRSSSFIFRVNLARNLMASSHAEGIMSSEQVENLQRYIEATKMRLAERDGRR